MRDLTPEQVETVVMASNTLRTVGFSSLADELDDILSYIYVTNCIEYADWIKDAIKEFEAQAQVLINNSCIIDEANKFKKEPIVKLILSGREVLARIEGEEAE